MIGPIRLFIYFLIAGCAHQFVFGIGAIPYPVEIQQPDGSSLKVTIRGDEWANWTETPDGYRIVKNKQGIFEYATLSASGNAVAGGVRVSNQVFRSKEEIKYISSLTKGFTTATEKTVPTHKAIQRSIRLSSVNQTSKQIDGKMNLLVILASFSDTEPIYSQNQFHNLMNQENYNGTGSFRDFYLENSNGLLDVNSVVTAWVKVPKSHDYYGPESKWVEFAYQAVKAAYNTGIDFSQFDNDGDGVVDGVAIIHQGNGQESTADKTDIWSHAYTLEASYTQTQRTFGGMVVANYFTQPELNSSGNEMATIGVACHEFGHVLGALDFYDTDYKENGQYDGTARWDLMADGAYNGSPYGCYPAHHNPFTKREFGWVEEVVLASPSKLVAEPVITSQKIFRINTSSSNEYFLLENRIKKGFDSRLPGEGLIIYHVDEEFIDNHAENNDVNAYEHQGMYIKVASGDINSSSCPFPGTSVVEEFHDESSPASLSWDGQYTNQSVTDIAYDSNNVNFRFMALQQGMPLYFKAAALNDTSVVLKWIPSENNDPVMITYSSENSFSPLQGGIRYQMGDTLDKGDSVLFLGEMTDSLIHRVGSTILSPHYYRLYSVFDTDYSASLKSSVTNRNVIHFKIRDLQQNVLDQAVVTIGDHSIVSDASGYAYIKGDYGSVNYLSFSVSKEGYETRWGALKLKDYNQVGVTLIEKPLPVVNAIVNHSVDYKTVSLSWNPVIYDNFSDYKAFSTSLKNWTFLDIDQESTYSIGSLDFPNEGYTGSFIVFDGFHEDFINQGIAFTNYSGRYFLGCISAKGEANDDWLVSPEIVIDEGTILSFMARSVNNQYGLERIRVLVSDGSIDPGYFNQISDGDYIEVPVSWSQYSYDLSSFAGKKIRFAIQCVSDNAFMLMIDRIVLSEKVPLFMGMKQETGDSFKLTKIATIEEKQLKTAEYQKEFESIESGFSGNVDYWVYKNNSLLGSVKGFANCQFTDVAESCDIQHYTITPAIDDLEIKNNSYTDSVLNCHVIKMRFTDGIEVVRGLNVSFNGETFQSNDLGEVVFSGVDEGELKVMASLTGYKDFETQLVVEKNNEYDLIVELDFSNTHAVVTPNPTNGRVTIQLPDGIESAEYSLFSLNGNCMLQGSSGVYRFILDLPSLPVGIYYLQLRYGTKSETLKLFLKN